MQPGLLHRKQWLHARGLLPTPASPLVLHFLCVYRDIQFEECK